MSGGDELVLLEALNCFVLVSFAGEGFGPVVRLEQTPSRRLHSTSLKFAIPRWRFQHPDLVSGLWRQLVEMNFALIGC